MSAFGLIATLLALSALFGWLNHRFLHLPHSVGLLTLGLLSSLLLIIVELLFPQEQFHEQLTTALKEIDFATVVLKRNARLSALCGSAQRQF